MNAQSNSPSNDAAKPLARHAKRQGLNHALNAIGKQFGETPAQPAKPNPTEPKTKIKPTKPWARRTSEFRNS